MSMSVAIDQKPLYRKVAWRLIPFLLACYTIAIIDRFNISFAKLQFLRDLHLDDRAFGLAAGIFSVGYVLLEVPSNLLLVRIGLRRTLFRIMVLWGCVTMLLLLAQNQWQLYILRFVLGAAEGGLFPGVLFYLTLWFPDHLRGRMTSLFVMAVPFGGIIAGPVSGMLMDGMQGVGGLHGWQWLFAIEGAPAIVLGVAAYFCLPDRPSEARWLTPAEAATIEAGAGGQRGPAHHTAFGAALRDRNVYLLAFVYFCFFCSLNSILLWAPSLLRQVGVTTATTIGWLSGGISVVSALGMVMVGASSDRFLERRWHVGLSGLVAAACFGLLPVAAGSVGATVALLAVASVAIYSILSLFWTIPGAYLQGDAAAGGIALISAIGSFGGAVCPAFVGWLTVSTGSLYSALAAVGALHAAGMAVLLVYGPSPQDETAGSLARATSA
jgi:MFS family permease